MMKNVSKPVLMGLTFPLPPKNKQTSMVKALFGSRATAAALREQASTTRAKAWADFEAAIYSGENDLGHIIPNV